MKQLMLEVVGLGSKEPRILPVRTAWWLPSGKLYSLTCSLPGGVDELHMLDWDNTGEFKDSYGNITGKLINPYTELITSSEELVAEAEQLRDVAKEFVERVERGEVVSTYTYNKLKKILK